MSGDNFAVLYVSVSALSYKGDQELGNSFRASKYFSLHSSKQLDGLLGLGFLKFSS